MVVWSLGLQWNDQTSPNVHKIQEVFSSPSALVVSTTHLKQVLDALLWWGDASHDWAGRHALGGFEPFSITNGNPVAVNRRRLVTCVAIIGKIDVQHRRAHKYTAGLCD